VLCVSLVCHVFLDHPQNYRVCWRGSRPSSVRVSEKQDIQKQKIKTNLRKLGLDKLDKIDFEDDQKVSRRKKKNQKKTENYTKSNKRSNLDHLFPGNGAKKRDLLTVYIRIKVHVDLQADKSSVVVKGPFFPQV
jgi:preprotein translocase subunit SecF